MRKLATGLVVALWFACGALAYAGTFAYFWEKYPTQHSELEYRQTIADAALIGFAGPVGLVAAAFHTGFFYYGLKWR